MLYTGVSLRIVQNFYKQPFYRTPSVAAFMTIYKTSPELHLSILQRHNSITSRRSSATL